MPFDNPYFPTQFDVGTINGPHIHMDSNGLDATDGVGNHVLIEPLPGALGVAPNIVFQLAGLAANDVAGIFAAISLGQPQLALESPAGGNGSRGSLILSGDNGGVKPSFAQLAGGTMQALIDNSFHVQDANKGELFRIDPTAAATLTWDGVSFTVPTALREVIGEAWTAYVPVLVNMALGNGNMTARYRKLGKTCFVDVTIQAGSTTGISAGVTTPLSISLPFTAKQDSSLSGMVTAPGGQVCVMSADVVAGSQAARVAAGTQALTSTFPFGLAAGQVMTIGGSYETT